MQAYRLETTLMQNNTLILDRLPFRSGDVVEVIVLSKEPKPIQNAYPLRGLPITYITPFEPVAQSDWEVLP
jgi:hypothetical protein